MYILTKIINRKTKNNVCSQYLNKPIKDIDVFLDKPLQVFYENGSFFSHEKVERLECDKYHDELLIFTTKKIWVLKEYIIKGDEMRR